jgi:uncharacterized protein YbjT (DUF2867 family)
VLTRSAGIDVTSGRGVAAALKGVDVVIDVTNAATLSARTARTFFEKATSHLLRGEEQASVGHHVVLSIVGIDAIDASYYAGKLAQERAVAAGKIPYTIARAAQFHEFAGQLLAGLKGPIAVMPKALIRPVAAREVGAHLVALAENPPARRATDLVGPRDERLADLARRLLAHDGSRRRVLELRLPGTYGAGLASGSLRGAEPRTQGALTFDAWLESDDHHSDA